jgi:RNA polymerase sigma factor (sigma-70 family)
LNTITDNALMLKVKSGDLDKLGLLFERYKRAMFSFFYRLSGQKSLSEDLVQTLFLRVLKYKHTFTGEGEFRTWLYHLARNTWADEYKRSRKAGFQEDIHDWQELLTDNHTIATIQKEEEIKLLHIAISQLSEEKREVLILSKYQELKYQEIAEIMHTTEGNIKVMVYRAIADLKRIYTALEK